jgi:DNA-directed RNA polymerase subunit N (RpoN/RPB10)
MSYIKCPTCYTVFANKEVLYRERLEKICGDQKMDDAEKKDAKKQLLTELQLIRPCCRMRMMGLVRLVDIIR